jgi:replicative DNA helicase
VPLCSDSLTYKSQTRDREEVFKKKEDMLPYEGKAELIVAKQRNGPTDSLPLAFLKTYSRFENLALDEQ